MDLPLFFKSVLEQDEAPIVLCDLNHIIVYMNPAAIKRYADHGGAALIGKSLLACHNSASCARIEATLDWFSADIEHNKIYESRNDKENKDVYIVALRDNDGKLIGYYEKHMYRSPETEKQYNFR